MPFSTSIFVHEVFVRKPETVLNNKVATVHHTAEPRSVNCGSLMGKHHGASNEGADCELEMKQQVRG